MKVHGTFFLKARVFNKNKTLFLIWSLLRKITEIKMTYKEFVIFAQNRGEQFYPLCYLPYVSHIILVMEPYLHMYLEPIINFSLQKLVRCEHLIVTRNDFIKHNISLSVVKNVQ